MPSERETTASNHLLFHRACANSHSPLDAFDVKFICQLIFAGSVCTKECKFLTKGADKRAIHTPYSKMAASLLFFCLHGNWPSLPRQHVQNTKEF